MKQTTEYYILPTKGEPNDWGDIIVEYMDDLDQMIRITDTAGQEIELTPLQWERTKIFTDKLLDQYKGDHK